MATDCGGKTEGNQAGSGEVPVFDIQQDRRNSKENGMLDLIKIKPNPQIIA
jgi:hypothetical protein